MSFDRIVKKNMYKYMPTSICCSSTLNKIDLLKCIFEDNTLRFTSPLYFNDPFEFRFPIKNLNPSSSENLNELINLLNATFSLHNNALDNVLQDVGVLCLSSKFDDLKMWGHYADNHKGIVLEFDNKHDFFYKSTDDIKLIHELKKVNYSKERLTFETENEYFNTIENENGLIYLTKNKEWEHEQEYRMTIKFDESNNSNKYNVKFPTEIIKSVYIGVNASEKDIQYIIDLKKQDKWNHLQIYRFTIGSNEYKLVPLKAVSRNITK